MRHSITVVALLVVASLSAPASAGTRDVKKAFGELVKFAQDAAKTGDPKEAFTPDAVKRAGTSDKERADAALARATLIREIGQAKVVKVRSKNDEAVVRYTLPRLRGVVREVPMRTVAGVWKLDALRSYDIDGPDLDGRVDNRTAKMTLKRRTESKAYGPTAYSFAHANGNAKECKNRVDIWICHNEDIHTRMGKNRIVSLGKARLETIDEIPVGFAWSDRPVRMEAGHAYVVHCFDRRGRDFYVKLRIVKLGRDAVDFEWSLLTTGIGAPRSIHVATKSESRDGADGHEGLCGKSR